MNRIGLKRDHEKLMKLMQRSLISMQLHFNILTIFFIKKNAIKKQNAILDETDSEEFITSGEESQNKERSKSTSMKLLNSQKTENENYESRSTFFKIKRSTFFDLLEEKAIEHNYEKNIELFHNFSGKFFSKIIIY
jgi:flagellar motility protein MotE (MotC chaperone)